MLASFWKRAGIGFLFGLFIGNLIAWFTGGVIVSPILVERMGSEAAAIVVQTLCSGIYGVITMGGTLLYDVERLPLALATALHCLLVIGPYMPLALLLGWESEISDILIVWCFQLAAFFIIWLIMYLRYKAQVRELNELMKKDKGGNGT
ncbi:MAG: DUF3021 domain-containing protein [Clostridia bacterium]|nr:DUF3021 domain-containing protein [Clostridia bacterium]